jgi:flagellum-specific ATP synthase
LISINLNKYKKVLYANSFLKFSGRVSKVVGLTIESDGPKVNVGELCYLCDINGKKMADAEVVGFRNEKVLLMPLGEMRGIGPGSIVVATGDQMRIPVSEDLLGRVVDGLGNPIDGKENIEYDAFYSINNEPPHPLRRSRIEEPLPLGVKAIDGLITAGKGKEWVYFQAVEWEKVHCLV